MFKKGVFGIGLLVVLALGAVPVRAEQPVRFTPAFGTMWDHSFLWTLGLSVDLYLTKNLTITPEFYMANKEFSFKVSKGEDMSNYYPTFFLQPGVMLNFHHPIFFVGAGVVISYQARNGWSYEGSGYPPTVVWNVVWSSVSKLKLNAGYKISKIRFTAFFLTDFQDLGWFPTAVSNAYGATIGYTF